MDQPTTPPQVMIQRYRKGGSRHGKWSIYHLTGRRALKEEVGHVKAQLRGERAVVLW